MTKKKTPQNQYKPPPMPPVKFVRKMENGKYEHGHIVLGLTRAEDKYVRAGIVDTCEAAANAQSFAPAVAHCSSGSTLYDNPHRRDFGDRFQQREAM